MSEPRVCRKQNPQQRPKGEHLDGECDPGTRRGHGEWVPGKAAPSLGAATGLRAGREWEVFTHRLHLPLVTVALWGSNSSCASGLETAQAKKDQEGHRQVRGTRQVTPACEACQNCMENQ